MSTYKTINPATGETVRTFDTISDDQMHKVVERSHAAYRVWRDTDLQVRTAALTRVAELIRSRMNELSDILTLEVGKPAAEARDEVALAARIFQYYADNAEALLADEEIQNAGSGAALIRTEAIGALIGIMPWNYPYYQVARFAAPNLALGNTIVLKHACNCPQAALALERILHDAGISIDAYINVYATNEQIAEAIADPRIQGVSLTGSERAGSAVGEVAGRHRKKYVLELGGSDPLLVLADADLDAAVKASVDSRLGNAGQACTAIKRVVVVDDAYEEFLVRYIRVMSATEFGDPRKSTARLGPLCSREAVAGLHEIVEDAVAKGATLHTGGYLVSGPGTYYPPTVLSDVTPDMRAYREELFGPVGTVYRARDVDDAVSIANNSPYGLGASVFTADDKAALEIADRLEVGMVWINSTSKSAPELPFGGVKGSGVGRELGHLGIREFANKKLIRDPGPTAQSARP